MKKLLLIVILNIFIVIGCTTTRYIEVPIETVHTEYVDKYHYDSIAIHDSIDRYIKGDTFYIYKEKLVYKYINSTDTCIITDTIPVVLVVTEIKEVNRIKPWQSSFMCIGAASLIFIVGAIIKKLKSIFIK